MLQDPRPRAAAAALAPGHLIVQHQDKATDAPQWGLNDPIIPHVSGPVGVQGCFQFLPLAGQVREGFPRSLWMDMLKGMDADSRMRQTTNSIFYSESISMPLSTVCWPVTVQMLSQRSHPT
jgi:hypothetical protein